MRRHAAFRPAMLGAGLLLLLTVPAWAEDPCVSGVPVGQRPGPYSFLVATGPQRGQLTCYICETADKPAAVVFARSMSDPLAHLVQKLGVAVETHKASDLQSWVTFLSTDQTRMDPKVVAWAKENALRNVPLGVFEDAEGPPTYRLAEEADVTVLLFVKQKVVANHAFRAGELTEEKADEVIKHLGLIVGKK